MNKKYNTLLITIEVFLTGYNKRGIAQYRVYVRSNRPQNDNDINSLFADFTFDNSKISGTKNMIKRFNQINWYIIGLSMNSYKIAVEYNICAYSFQRMLK
jgi:hypothetical protein